MSGMKSYPKLYDYMCQGIALRGSSRCLRFARVSQELRYVLSACRSLHDYAAKACTSTFAVKFFSAGESRRRIWVVVLEMVGRMIICSAFGAESLLPTVNFDRFVPIRSGKTKVGIFATKTLLDQSTENFRCRKAAVSLIHTEYHFRFSKRPNRRTNRVNQLTAGSVNLKKHSNNLILSNAHNARFLFWNKSCYYKYN